jgi:hypothetical protein
MNRPTRRCTVSPHNPEYEGRLNQALQHAADLSDHELLQLPVEIITEALTNEYSAKPLEIHFGELWCDLEDLPGASQTVKVSIPVTGCTRVLFAQTITVPLSAHTYGPKGNISFPISISDAQLVESPPTTLKSLIDNACDRLQALADQANKEIAIHRERMRNFIHQALSPRVQRLQAFRQAVNTLGIPLTPRSNSISLQPRGITLDQLDKAISSGVKEWHLEDQIAEHIIDTVISFNTALERLVRTASKLTEEGEPTIRDLLLFILNASYQGAATGETFVGHGKTDILLRWHNRDAFIAECKIWTGGEHFMLALEQLLDRYTIWRDTRVAIVLFIRDIKDIQSIIDKARDCITKHHRTLQPLKAQEPSKRSDFLIHAKTDEQRIIRLSLLPVIIPKQYSVTR